MKKFALVSLTFLMPAMAFAQSPNTQINNLQDLSTFLIAFINNILVPFVFAISFLFFIWGVFTYLIRGASDKEQREKGRDIVIYSVIGFAAMLTIWGLVHLLTGTLRLDYRTPGPGSELPQAAPSRTQ